MRGGNHPASDSTEAYGRRDRSKNSKMGRKPWGPVRNELLNGRRENPRAPPVRETDGQVTGEMTEGIKEQDWQLSCGNKRQQLGHGKKARGGESDAFLPPGPGALGGHMRRNCVEGKKKPKRDTYRLRGITNGVDLSSTCLVEKKHVEKGDIDRTLTFLGAEEFVPVGAHSAH